MIDNDDKRRRHEEYFSHLRNISVSGRIYKRFFASPILYFCARRFGRRIVEVGAGTGSGISGAFRKQVRGLDINPLAVAYCVDIGLNVQLIGEDGKFPIPDGAVDSCVLDNVLEHIEDPRQALGECYRVTRSNGGLIVAVPGLRGHASDPDHKKLYDSQALENLDPRWRLKEIFSMPFFFTSEALSGSIRQYCLIAIYEKV
jgi:SAM-dependent methyltransferase